MSFIIFLVQKCLNVIYCFFKLLPTDPNMILFVSRQSDTPTVDFRMLENELNKFGNKKIIMITKRIEKNYFDAIRKNFFIAFKQMYFLAKSSVCIVDGYNVTISFLTHKKSLKIYQLWHSLGAIKKFGYQTMKSKKEKRVAEVSRLHKNYDYIIASSENEIPFLMEAFNYDESYFYVAGLPRIDYLLKRRKRNRKKIYQKYPAFADKKVILYAPTFRENDDYRFEELIDLIDYDKYVLIIKKHEKINFPIENLKEAYIVDDFSTLQLLSVADYVITDYSAVSLEASILDIPIFIWAYDIDYYQEKPGLNMDLEKEFGPYFSKDITHIYNKLQEKYDSSIVTNFKVKNIKYLDKKVTKRLAEFILKENRNEKAKKMDY